MIKDGCKNKFALFFKSDKSVAESKLTNDSNRTLNIDLDHQ